MWWNNSSLEAWCQVYPKVDPSSCKEPHWKVRKRCVQGGNDCLLSIHILWANCNDLEAHQAHIIKLLDSWLHSTERNSPQGSLWTAQSFVEGARDHRALCGIFIGEVARKFEDGSLNEEYVENPEETHFLINVDDGKTLVFKRDEEMWYAEVVSGGEWMKMILRIIGGEISQIQIPFMIFKKKYSNY